MNESNFNADVFTGHNRYSYQTLDDAKANCLHRHV